MAPFDFRNPATYGPSGMFTPPEPEPPMWDPSLEELAQMYQQSIQTAPPPGFLDRLAMGLQGIQGPSWGSGAALAGLAQGFAGARMGGMQRADMERARQNQANLEATRAYVQSRMNTSSDARMRRRQREDDERRARMQKPPEPKSDAGTLPILTDEEATKLGRPKGSRATVEEFKGAFPERYRTERNDRLVQVMGPDGNAIWVPESQAEGQATGRPRAVTGLENQALAFYNRAKDASESVVELEPIIARSGLLAQGRLQYAPNTLQTPQQRQYRQAQRAFTEARLRKESGAAIPEHEYENDSKTYFARPGDDPDTIEQKRLARNVVLDGLAFASGRAYENYYGVPMTKTQTPEAKAKQKSNKVPGYEGWEFVP